MKPDEAAFESHIVGWLVEHGGYTGWKLGTQSDDFDADLGDTVELFAFIEDIQCDERAKVLKTRAGDSAAGRAGFLDRPAGTLEDGRPMGCGLVAWLGVEQGSRNVGAVLYDRTYVREGNST